MVEQELAEPTVVYADVEVLGPEDIDHNHGQTGLNIHTAELLDMLVSRFEDTLLSRERENDILQRSLQEVQERADIDGVELATTQQVLRIMERENLRLQAEVETLRSQATETEALRAQLVELEELRQQVTNLKKRRRLAMELDELRKQVSELSFSSDRMLEQLLGQQSYR